MKGVNKQNAVFGKEKECILKLVRRVAWPTFKSTGNVQTPFLHLARAAIQFSQTLIIEDYW